MEITAMDVVRAVIANAQHEGMTVDDLAAMAEHADDLIDWDDAINELAQMMTAGHTCKRVRTDT